MSFIQSICGTLTVEITSADPGSALEEIMISGVSISSITKKSELIFSFRIHRKDFPSVNQILKRRGDTLNCVCRHGIYWKLKEILYRPVLCGVILLLLIMTLYLPTKIFFIETEGNLTLTDTEILSAAEKCGVSFGASRKHIRSEKVKNELLSFIPKLQWAGINTIGCRAVISVKERVDAENSRHENYLSNLVAEQDAYILSATVTEGTAVVRPGDSVVAGQTLVSGYADHGFCIQATKSSGEILGLTNRKISASMPAQYQLITENKDVSYKISLLLRKKRINLWKDSRISDTCCGRMYEEYYVSLPGGFQLPIAICVDRYVPYLLNTQTVSEPEASRILSDLSDRYLGTQMIAGQILQKNQQLVASVGVYRLKSSYICTEMIGREQREQIGDHNGKRN